MVPNLCLLLANLEVTYIDTDQIQDRIRQFHHHHHLKPSLSMKLAN